MYGKKSWFHKGQQYLEMEIAYMRDKTSKQSIEMEEQDQVSKLREEALR